MFNCITGVVPGYKGDIRYEGRDLRHLKPHQRARLKIARTFQNLELFDELSALDNLLVPLDAFSRRGIIGDLLRLPTTVLDERTARGAGAVDPALPRASATTPTRRPATCRSVCSGAWRSDARSVSSRGCCCSTSRRPGSTRGRPPSWPDCSRRCGPASRSRAHRRPRHGADHAHLQPHLRARQRAGSSPTGHPQQIRDDPQVVRAYLGEAAAA